MPDLTWKWKGDFEKLCAIEGSLSASTGTYCMPLSLKEIEIDREDLDLNHDIILVKEV